MTSILNNPDSAGAPRGSDVPSQDRTDADPACDPAPDSESPASNPRRSAAWWRRCDPGVRPVWSVGVALLLAGVVFVSSRLLTLDLPLERDEGEYAYIAARMLDGDVPYRDQFDQKPPGVFFVYAAAFTAFGPSARSAHLALLIASACTAWLLYRLVRDAAGRLPAALAVLAFVVVGIDPSILGSAANTEAFANLPIVWVMLLVVSIHRGAGPTRWGLCGLGCALAFLFKQVAAVVVAWAIVWLVVSVVRDYRRTGSFRWSCGAAWLAGFAIPLIALAAWFLAQGAWEAMLDCVFVHNFEYIGRRTLGQGAAALPAAFERQWPALAIVWFLAFVGVLFRAGSRRNAAAKAGRTDDEPNPTASATPTIPADTAVPPGADAVAIEPEPLSASNPRLFWGGWLACTFVAASFSLNYYPHYFVWLVPPLSALAGIGAGRVIQRLGRGSTVLGWIVFVTVVAGIIAPPAWANRRIWTAPTPVERVRWIYGQNPYAESPQIAEYIRTQSRPGDRVFILGSEPQILFYAGRQSATRYILMYPLFGPYADAAARRREVLDDLNRSDPEWIVEVLLWTSRTPDEPRRPSNLELEISSRVSRSGRYILEGVVIPRPRLRGYELRFGQRARDSFNRHPDIANGGMLIYKRRP